MNTTTVAAKPDQELVKGLGLTSATTLVMGSMIGSGIFIVSADIGRLVDSPALLIAATLDPDLVVYQVRSKADPRHRLRAAY